MLCASGRQSRCRKCRWRRRPPRCASRRWSGIPPPPRLPRRPLFDIIPAMKMHPSHRPCRFALAASPARSRTIDLRGNVTHTGNLGSVPSRWLGGSVVRWLGSCANPQARDAHLEPRKRGSCPQRAHFEISHYSQRAGEYYADCLRSRGVCPQVFQEESYPRTNAIHLILPPTSVQS